MSPVSRKRLALKQAARRTQYARAVGDSRRRLARLGTGVPERPGEIRLFAKARNESTRWPWFLQHYRSLGVDRFLIVDNGSDDGFAELADAEPDVHVFTTDESLQRHPLWFDVLLADHGIGHWCVAADLDELLVLPPGHGPTLADAAATLHRRRASALDAVLVDLYPRGALADSIYVIGIDPLVVVDHFDPTIEETVTRPLNERTQQRFEAIRYGGGPRRRCFGVDPNLTKVPFFRCDGDTWLSAGAHHLDCGRFGEGRAAMLHLKYLHDVVDRTVEAADRGVYADAGGTISAVADALSAQDGLSFHFDGSVRHSGIDALVRTGIVRDTRPHVPAAVSL